MSALKDQSETDKLIGKNISLKLYEKIYFFNIMEMFDLSPWTQTIRIPTMLLSIHIQLGGSKQLSFNNVRKIKLFPKLTRLSVRMLNYSFGVDKFTS